MSLTQTLTLLQLPTGHLKTRDYIGLTSLGIGMRTSSGGGGGGIITPTTQWNLENPLKWAKMFRKNVWF